MPSARQATSERNRERILEVASDLFSTRGATGTTISAICKAAEVVPPTLYWHFDSKEGLLAAVMEHVASSWFDTLELPDDPGPRDLARHVESRPDFVRLAMLLALERREVDPDTLMSLRRVRGRIKEVIGSRVDKWLTIKDPKRRAAACERLVGLTLIAIDGGFIVSQIDGPEAHLPELIDDLDRGIRDAAKRMNAEARA